MYLTNDEFIIIKGMLEGLSLNDISKNLNKTLCTCDPRIDSVFQKFGVSSKADFQKVNLDKVELCEKENMPYFEYDNKQLVKKIPVRKKDIAKIYNIFKNISNEHTKFNLVCSTNKLYGYLYLENSTGKEYIYKTMAIKPER